jgi:hypothetical protein
MSFENDIKNEMKNWMAVNEFIFDVFFSAQNTTLIVHI